MASILRSTLGKAIRPFRDLTKAPRAIWYVIGAFVIDSTAYFGILTLMTTYLGHDLGWGDAYAAATVSLFTMLVTLAMLGVGSVAESFGLRRAILVGLAAAPMTARKRSRACIACNHTPEQTRDREKRFTPNDGFLQDIRFLSPEPDYASGRYLGHHISIPIRVMET
jgi:hypothetical protein